MWQARRNVISLWLSQVARVAADNALRFFVVWLLFFAADGAARASAWYLVTALLMAPAVLLAPLNGALCNSLPKRAVLIGAAAWTLFATCLGFAGVADPERGWLWSWGLVAVGAAVYGPTRYAFLPAAAQDTRWPLTRLNGWFEMGAAAAVVAGIIAALRLDEAVWSGYPAAAVLAAGLGGVALLFAVPVQFSSDVRRPEGGLAAVRSFFTDARTIWADHEARVCLVGLALLRGIVTGLAGALLPRLMSDAAPPFAQMLAVGTWIGWIMGGLALGALLAGLQRHPFRVLGLVPWGATGLTLALVYLACTAMPSPWLLAVFGLLTGLVNVPLAATYQADLPADARGNGMAIRNFADYLVVAVTSVVLYLLARYLDLPPAGQLALLAVVCGIAAGYSWWFCRRATFELIVEGIFLIMYRFRFAGPGVESFPRRGPVLIIANHSAWIDPAWLAKLLPRPFSAMMTSDFFDIRRIRWMFVHLFQAIRVQNTAYRRDAPELLEAVAALDRGACVLIFPEGGMRRREDRPLKMFGQGVWHILRDRPETPVVFCWIEGSWGSFFSYKGGPPTKNKRMDVRHLIQIAIGAAERIPPEALTDLLHARTYLMQRCLEMRGALGLAPFTLDKVEAQPAEVQEKIVEENAEADPR